MENDAILVFTADIVAAHVGNNGVPTADIGNLIANVHGALAGLRQGSGRPAVSKRQPAVPVRASVKPDKVTCLECGFSGKMLKRHLGVAHALSEADYRIKWALRSDHPLVAPLYSQLRSEQAKALGVQRKSSKLSAKDALAKSRKRLGLKMGE
ncbi:MucR family transcriptional regulator [Sphingomonas sp. MM-1]|uniref:MucR family transcriptional regulator n=1 Tax=Sphingomonas sp. MM-1 TaxID=745310 RepID=UPI0002C13EAF|nr:MucR family transcriptional regulator [Sphingomonas sp. MM-1]AGH49653.1 MucR family transcriptional regulator [Sphingomonas sp. MM-1]